MNSKSFFAGLGIATMFTLALTTKAAEIITLDLKAISEGKNSRPYRATAEWVQDDGGKPALKLKTAPGTDGFVEITDLQFTNGTIEFDSKGKSGPPQSNFIGIAFRVE